MNIDSVGVSVPGGGRVDAGSWIVVNAIFREQTGKTVCPDAFADRIQVAVWTRDAPVRENGGIAAPAMQLSLSSKPKERPSIGASRMALFRASAQR